MIELDPFHELKGHFKNARQLSEVMNHYQTQQYLNNENFHFDCLISLNIASLTLPCIFWVRVFNRVPLHLSHSQRFSHSFPWKKHM